MRYEEMYFQMDSCISCGLCASVCPVMQGMGTAAAPLLGPLFSAFGSRWDLYTYQEAAAACTQCGLCREACPRDIDIPAVVRWIRAEARGRAGELPAAVPMVESLLSRGNPYDLPAKELAAVLAGLRATAGTSYLFYPGCTTLARNPAVVRAWEGFAARMGISYTTLGEKHRCCGSRLLAWGYEAEARQLAAATTEIIAGKLASGGTIITDCPHCWQMLRSEYPRLLGDFPYHVIHITHLLRDMLPEGEEKIPEKAAYFVPCRLQGHAAAAAGVTATRSLCSSVVELGSDFCCGEGEGTGTVNPCIPANLAGVVGQRARTLQAEFLVAGCPHCRERLQEANPGLPVLDLLQLAARGKKEPPA